MQAPCLLATVRIPLPMPIHLSIPTWLRAASLALVVAAAAGPIPRAQSPQPRDIEVVARRFAFEPAEVDVTVGERVRLLVRSADGVHGVEIEQFRVNKEIPRGGKPVAIEFTASQEGRFPILCSEYCGDGHEEMTGTLVVRAAGAPAPEPR